MNRKEFKNRIKENIDLFDQKIDELELKKEQLQSDLKSEYDKQLLRLQIKRNELKEKLDEVEDIAEDNWDEAKVSFGKSIDSFKDGLSKIGDIFKSL